MPLYQRVKVFIAAQIAHGEASTLKNFIQLFSLLLNFFFKQIYDFVGRSDKIFSPF